MEITKIDENGFSLSSKSIEVALNAQYDKADVVLMSQVTEKLKKSDAILFDSPGEYEVKNCMIDAIDLGDGNTGFSILTEDIRIAYIDGVKDVLSDAQVEGFASVDILIAPLVGEKVEITTKIINQIEPKVVIPHHYSPEQLKFLSDEFGVEQEVVTKCKLTKKELVENEQQRLVVLS